MPGCIYSNLDKDYSIEDLAAFHGHIGPYIVLGYRIGRYVKKYFCHDPFHMAANVYCNGTPPQSCLVDGVQIGSGCTLGKRNIDITVSDQIKCIFESDGKKVVIAPRPIKFPPKDVDDYFKKIEALALEMYGMDDIELFEVSNK